MLIDRLRRAYALARLPTVLVLSLFTACIALCLAVTAWDLHRKLQRDLDAMQVRTARILDSLDQVLAAVMLEVKDGSCEDRVDQLRRHASFDHRVRSLALVDQSSVYCTSLFPDDRYRLSDVADALSPIRLHAGSPRWPDSPVFTIRRIEQGRGVLAFVSGNALVPAMPTLGPGTYAVHMGDLSFVGQKVVERASLARPWLSDSREVRPGVSVERRLEREHVLERLRQVLPTGLGLALLISALGAVIYCRAYVKGCLLPNQIRSALARRQFVPFYQPIVLSAPGYPVAGFEVLIRWNKPGEGVVAPVDFLAVAERSELLLAMTDSLIEQVIADIKAGPALQGRTLGLNLAAGHLRNSSRVLALAQRFLTGTAGTGARLTLEISERSIKADLAACQETLEAVKAMGVHLSVDDFCTGNANLDTLCAMRFDNVKCDRFIVGLIDCGDQREVIPAGVVELIHKLGFAVVVEGIESAEQADFFAARGVRYLQGFYFGRPMPYAELAPWLARHQTRFATASERSAGMEQRA